MARDESEAVYTRLPGPMMRAIRAESDRRGMTRSATLRDLITDGLRAAGTWPPPLPAKDDR